MQLIIPSNLSYYNTIVIPLIAAAHTSMKKVFSFQLNLYSLYSLCFLNYFFALSASTNKSFILCTIFLMFIPAGQLLMHLPHPVQAI